MGKVLFLSAQNLESVGIKTPDLVYELEELFLAEQRGDVTMAKKVSMRFPDKEGTFLNSMPAYLKYQGVAGIKWVGGFPEAIKQGQPFITGVVVLNDCSNGQPICFMDGTLITLWRTAAVSVLGAKYLAKANAYSLGIIGCGQQGRAHLMAMVDYLPFKKAYCYDAMPNVADKAVHELQGRNGVQLVTCSSWQEVLAKSDVICTCTLPQEPFLSYEYVKEGSLVISIEGRQSWLTTSYGRFSKLCVDEWEGIKEGGHVKPLVSQGTLTEESVHAGLKELVNNREKGRVNNSETILLLTRGLGAEDIAVANLFYRRALELGLGTELTLF